MQRFEQGGAECLPNRGNSSKLASKEHSVSGGEQEGLIEMFDGVTLPRNWTTMFSTEFPNTEWEPPPGESSTPGPQ